MKSVVQEELPDGRRLCIPCLLACVRNVRMESLYFVENVTAGFGVVHERQVTG